MDYVNMKVAQLKAICDERGIEYKGNARKADLVALLEKSEKPIEVQASVVEESIIPQNALSLDIESMQDAAIALTQAIDAAATTFGDMQADAETISAMSVPEVRICEDGIAAAIKEVDERRLELTRMLTTPKKVIDDKCKEMTEPLRDLAAMYANARESKYLQGYEAQYQECCIANGMEALICAVPFSRFMAMHPRWTARNANPVKVQEKISEEVERIAADWATLRTMSDSMRFYDDAEVEFFRSLDVKRAIEANNRREADQARIDAMNAERAANEAWRKQRQQQAAMQNESKVEASQQANSGFASTFATEQNESKTQANTEDAQFTQSRYILDVTASQSEGALKELFKSAGIHGRLVAVNTGGENVVQLVKNGALEAFGITQRR